MAAVSLILVLLALALSTAWILAWPMLGAWRWFARRHPRAQAFNVVALGAPMLAGIVLSAGAVWPSANLNMGQWTCHCAPGDGAIHLCLAHPEGALPLLPGAVFLLVWLGWRPARVVREVVSRLWAARALVRGAWEMDARYGVKLGPLGGDNAFCAGLLRAVVLADRRWWRSLSDQERRIVAAHEHAHARCRDPLTHTMARLLAGFSPARLTGPLLHGWLDRAEIRADQAAARAAGDPLAVADLLLQQARASASPSLVPAFHGSGLQARIFALVDDDQRPPRFGSDLGAGLPMLFAAALLVGLFGYQIHSALERLLRLHP